jgi:DNA-binding NtrC family response regulator
VSARILVVDDESLVCTMLERVLGREGYEVETTTHPEEGLEKLKEANFDILITDLRMGGMDGLELLGRARRIQPNCEVVMMTGYATVETAREALKRGATDYIKKPLNIDNELKPLLATILSSEIPEPRPIPNDLAESRSSDALEGFIGRGPGTQPLLKRVHKVAASNAPVLLQGESGCGKEMVAGLLHALSSRSDRPFLKINCAALPESLLESELFGHVKGAFTGATADRDGLFKVADGGTLLLDEIGEISPTFQPKLLRVLQDGEFQRIGDSRTTIRVDVRLIAATNRNLSEAVKAGDFREDLYYRLNVVPITVPPLRERIEDLPDLLNHFIRLAAHKHQGYSEVRFSSEILAMLSRYPWPGNIRELSNAIESATVLSEQEEVRLEDLPVAIQDYMRNRPGQSMVAPISATATASDTLEDIEMRCILQSMAKTGFNRTRAAELLGVTRRTLSYRINKYELDTEIERLRRLSKGGNETESDGGSPGTIV